ncbi:MAG: GntR family transcriptional regulator [Dehalococcoidia bacterium]|nr:GntR family transcriptional regulator [Dehalococcoidia bacterium]
MGNDMIRMHLSQAAHVPLYKQIVEQVKQLIATDQLQPGEHLPTVRQLAYSLGISPGTVVRAYVELEQEQVVVSRRGGGTVVSAGTDDPRVSMLRQSRLSNMVSSNILEALSLGYSPEELEAAFSLHLARWREERKARGETFHDGANKIDTRDTIVIVGSHDLALNLLVSQLKHRNPEINVDVTHAGSLGGLIALQEERADLAGIHLLDEETGEYNYPYVKHILPGREMAIVHLAYRIQGLMFDRSNPKQIKGLEDLGRPEVTILNRQKGSGTRVLLDLKLRQHGIMPSEVKGYERELDTHLAVATGIARGEADVGLGIEAAAHTCDLGFLPLFRERYDLIIPIANYRSRLLSPLLEIIGSEDFMKVVANAGGYDTSQTGATTFCKYDN